MSTPDPTIVTIPLAGLPDPREVVLASTGHMVRFTHPDLYGHTITDFIDHELVAKSRRPSSLN